MNGYRERMATCRAAKESETMDTDVSHPTIRLSKRAMTTKIEALANVEKREKKIKRILRT